MSSSSQIAGTSSSNLDLMLFAALVEYKKNIGQDLQAHWLAAEIKTCSYVDGVLDIVRGHAIAFERSEDQKLMKYIDLLVHVLYTFSDALCDDVSMVLITIKSNDLK
jgi:hypothetical protein